MSQQYKDFKDEVPSYVNEENFDLFKSRHSAEHILMHAMQNLYGEKAFHMAMGPAIENGYYFDFEPLDLDLNEDAFKAIEKEMYKIKNKNLPITKKDVSLKEARKVFKNNPYKMEWLDIIEDKNTVITLYYTGDEFVDLCKGPHVDSTKDIGVVKLMSLAGAYWHGDEKNKMLTRLYGTAFSTKEELKKYLWQIEEAKKRDHRKLGKALDLFMFSDLVGPGLPMWTPRGTIFRNLIDDYVWELRKAKGYEKVTIPHITKKELYEKSGHWQKYSDDLFKINTREGHVFVMKPMNCPHHTQIYDHLQRSYKDLPQRYAETTMVYRDEQTGELSGLSRVRCITQDDAHVFCRKNQLEEEINSVWDVVDAFYSTFGFELEPTLSLHDPAKIKDYLGDAKLWEENEEYLRQTAKSRGVEAKEILGEAAFYGPKIDFIAKDSLGREMQVATIQLDTNMPNNFELDCVNENGEKERIVMLHVAIAGSLERFSSVIIEHFAGKFPAWLSPEQVKIIPISDKNLEYAKKVEASLLDSGVRVTIDSDSERMQAKVRQAQKMQTPYMLILGGKEEEEDTVSIRYRSGEQDNGIKFDVFKEKLLNNIKDRDLDIKL